MSGIELELRAPVTQRVDAQAISGDLLQLPLDEVQRLCLTQGSEEPSISDLFLVRTIDSPEVRVIGDLRSFDSIAGQMTQGGLTIDGSVGDYFAAGLKSGTVRVNGDAGAYAASGMRGGRVEVSGNVGEFLASPLVGQRRGMKGGVVWVGGNCGPRAADRLRRGTILIEGNAGDFIGSRMIAGTVIVLGKCGKSPACMMRRGSLILFNQPVDIPATFTKPQFVELDYLGLLWKSISKWHPRLNKLSRTATAATRYLGDQCVGGLGEILQMGPEPLA